MNFLSDLTIDGQVYFSGTTVDNTTLSSLLLASNNQVVKRTLGDMSLESTTNYFTKTSSDNRFLQSVAISLPAVFNVTGSPATPSGSTLTATFVSQIKNTILAAPDGFNGTPSFRTLTANDLPNLTTSFIQNQTVSAQTGSFRITGTGNIGNNLTVGGSVAAGGQVFLDFGNPGTGGTQGFRFLRASDSAGIEVSEPTSDLTKFEFYMSDNPDSGDYFSWRFTDHQGTNSLWQPLYIGAMTTRFMARTNTFYGDVIQSATPFYTVNSGLNNVNINDLNRLKSVGVGTTTITGLNIAGYTGTSGIPFWISIDGVGTPDTFKWGYGSMATTAVASLIPITASTQTLSNGIIVTFNSATGGTIGDSWQARLFKTATTTLGSTTVNGSLTSSNIIVNNTNGYDILFNGTSNTDIKHNVANTSFHISTIGTGLFLGGTSDAQHLSVLPTGNVLIGSTTDTGYRLDVNGTGRFNGTLTGTDGIFTAGGTSYGLAQTPTITLGTTNLTSGTIKLFGTASNAYSIIQTTTTNLHIDSSNVAGASTYINWYSARATIINGQGGNVLIGNATDAGFKLDVNGTTRLQNTLTLSTTPTMASGTFDLLARNPTTGAIERIDVVPILEGGTGSATQNFVDLTTNQTIAGVKTFTTEVKVTGTESRETGTYIAPTFSIGDIVSGNRYKWYSDVWIVGATRSTDTNSEALGFSINGTSRAKLFKNGNFGIGNTTDAGFKLDVNGTGRFAGSLSSGALINAGQYFMGQLNAQPTDSNVYSIYTTNAAGGSGVYPYVANGHLVLQSRSNVGSSDIIFNTSGSIVGYFKNTGNLHIGYTGGTDNGFKLDVNGTGRFTNATVNTASLVVQGVAPVAGQYGLISEFGSQGNGALRIFGHNSGTRSFGTWANWSTVNSRWEAQATTTVGATRQEFGIDGSISFFTQPAIAITGGTAIIFNNPLKLYGSGNVGIDATDAGFKLDVNGTTRIQGQAFFGTNFNIGTSGSYAGMLGFNRNVISGAILNTAYGAYQINNVAGTLGIEVYTSGGTLTTTHSFFNNGNIGIGTQANSVYKLDVQGSTRISGGLTLTNNTIETTTTDLILKIGTTNNAFRAVRASAWTDNVNSTFFQVGNISDNAFFTSLNGNILNRLAFSSSQTQITSGGFQGKVPLGIFEVTNGTNPFFNVHSTGNVTLNSTTDNGVDRLQVNGSASFTSKVTIGTPGAATNIANMQIIGGFGTLGDTAGLYTYLSEQQQNTTGNLNRLQTAAYRRVSGTTWQGAGFRLQSAVDNSFTTGGKAFIEIGATDPTVFGSGFISLGTEGADRLSVLGNGNVLIGTLTNAGYKLDVNGTGRFSGGLTTNLIEGSVPFIGASGLLTQDSTNLFFDNTNKRLFIGSATVPVPTADTKLYVKGTGSSLNTWKGRIVAGGDTVAFLMGEYNSKAWLGAHNAALNAWADLHIQPDGNNSTYMNTNGGNVLIGAATDAGFKLDVNGTARVSGGLTSQTLSPTTDLGFNLGLSGSRWNIGYINQVITNRVQVMSNNLLYTNSTNGNMGTMFNTTGNLLLSTGATQTDAGYKLDVNGTTNIAGNLDLGVVSNAGRINLKRGDGNTHGRIGYTSPTTTGDFEIASTGGGGLIGFVVGGGARYGQFFTSGNFTLQNGGIYTDAGFRLDVQGTARFTGLITGSISGNAGTATNLAAGTIGQIPYQSAANTTAMLGAGTLDQVLKSNGSAAPSWQTLDMTYLPDSTFKKSVRVATTTDIGISGVVGTTLVGYQATGSINITTTLGSTTATVATTVAIKVGAVLSGNVNIPTGTTVASITNATTFVLSAAATASGTLVATTFTQTISALVIDGITLALNDRVLIKNQSLRGGQADTVNRDNGIYYLSVLGTTSVRWELARVLDADSITEIASAIVAVDSGTVNGGTLWDNDLRTTDTLGTTAMPWSMMADSGKKLNFFASTTSAELATVLSDKTGTGSNVFNTAPTFSGIITVNSNLNMVSNGVTTLYRTVRTDATQEGLFGTDGFGNFTFNKIVSAASFTGTINTAAQPNITSVGTLTSLTSSGTITAPAFVGAISGTTGTFSGAVKFNSSLTVTGFTGTGTRMVVSDANGLLSTQVIPTDKLSEEISFTGATGVVTIDFGLNNRLTNFGTNPTLLVYEIISGVKTFYNVGYSYNTSSNILTVDGVQGNKTIVLVAGGTNSVVSNLFVPYSGATGAVNLNTQALTTSGVITAGSFVEGSLRSLKENIQNPTFNALEVINSVKVQQFNLKADTEKELKVGFIADDTDSLLSGSNQNIMNHGNTIGVLLAGVQNLVDIINKLEKRIIELENGQIN